MEIKLNYEQWELLKRVLRLAEAIEAESTTGSARLDDKNIMIDLHENVTITLPSKGVL